MRAIIRFGLVLTLTGVLAVLSACPQPEPVYDDDLNLQAVSVEPGSMAGTWAQKHSIVNVADLPLIGEQLAGGETYLKVDRELNDDGSYSQTTRLCSGRNYDVGGTASYMSDEKWRSVPPVTFETVEIDEARGTFSLRNHVQMWGFDIDDPIDGDFPKDKEEALADPFSDQILDADEDGNPGITLTLEGFAEGEVYFIQRKTVHLKGVIVEEDVHKGLVDDYLYETVNIGTNNELLENQLDRTEHEDPKQSWYQEARVEDGMDCDEVVEWIKDGGMPRLNPFLADG